MTRKVEKVRKYYLKQNQKSTIFTFYRIFAVNIHLPFGCNLCILNFTTQSERNEHIRRHFAQKCCRICDKSLIQIGDDWYELRLHVDDNCNISEKHEEIPFEEKDIKTEEPLSPAVSVDLSSVCHVSVEHGEGQYVPPLKVILTENNSECDDVISNNETEDGFPEKATVSQDDKHEYQNNDEMSVVDGLLNLVEIPQIQSNNCEERRFECELCEKKFTAMSSLKSHLKKGYHKKETFTCELCCAAFEDRESFKKHTNVEHDGKRYSCEICGNTYKERRSLNVHKSIHSQQDQVSCDICNKQFRHKEFLGRHMLIHTNKEKFKCDICSKEFGTVKSVKYHKQIVHEGKDLFKCEICEKNFASNGNLKLHMYTHSDSRPFICSYCGKGFIQGKLLMEHINSHTGERPNVCTICNKDFTRKLLLRIHMRVHTGEKPHKCKIEGCDRAYAYDIDLKRHKYSAHGIYTKKHICPVCSKVYPENKLLRRHLESHKAMDLNNSLG